MVGAAKKRGFRVVARMDPDLAYQEALEAYPEWFERNRDGSARTQAECSWLYKTCTFSTYFTDQMPAIYREINAHYPVDGFFTNGWPSTGSLEVCYCDACQKVFREKVGGVPPESTDASSLLYRRYYAAYMDRVLEIWKLWQRAAQEKKPDSVYIGNLGGGIDTVKSVKKLADVAASFRVDTFEAKVNEKVVPATPQAARDAAAAKIAEMNRDIETIRGKTETCTLPVKNLKALMISPYWSLVTLGPASNYGKNCTGPAFDKPHGLLLNDKKWLCAGI
jgi:hypothetical protein